MAYLLAVKAKDGVEIFSFKSKKARAETMKAFAKLGIQYATATGK